MAFHDGFLSAFVGKPAVVLDQPGVIGKIADFVIDRPDDAFPQIDSVAIRMKEGLRLAPIANVISVDRGGVMVLARRPDIECPPDDEALYLVEDLLDKQIVDVDGRKVVRINDIELAQTAGALRVVAAEVGVGGLLRRLSGGRIAKHLIDRVPRSTISWNNIAPIHDLNPNEIKLSVSQSRLARLHPSDLAEIIGDLSAQDAARIVGSLDDETAADALEHLDAETQLAIIEDLGTERAADIIEEMDSDDAADLLGELPAARQRELLAEMDAETAHDLRELAAYDEDTAAGMMTTDFVWIYPHRTVGATIEKIREIAPVTEFIYYLYVTDRSQQLLGVLSLRKLLLSPPEATIHTIMDQDLVTVEPSGRREDVAHTIARYDLLAVPVVNDGGTIIGIVTVDDAIDAIIPERLKKNLPRFTKAHKHASAAK
ncbi:MAG: CBS domain-containing protein [Candidatus Velthaea sp.]